MDWWMDYFGSVGSSGTSSVLFLNKRRTVLIVCSVGTETVSARRWFIELLWAVFGQVTLGAFDTP